MDTTLPPSNLQAGETWTAKFKVATCAGRAFQHVVPALRLEQRSTGRTLVVVGRRTGAAWVAEVRFPSAGTWSVSPGTRDGTLFGPHWVTIGAEPRTAGFARWPIASGLLALVLAAAIRFSRRRRLG